MNYALPQRTAAVPIHGGGLTLPAVMNVCLTIAVCALLAYTVAQVNMGAARAIQATQLGDRIQSLQERQSGLSAQRALMEEREPLMEFATAHGMIPVVATQYVVDEGGVAVVPGAALR